MGRKYRKRVEFLKNVQLILVVLCLIIAIAYIYNVTRPVISSRELKDECGPIGGRISHSIGDISMCENRCNAYCTSLEKKFHDVQFHENNQTCNKCNCFCEE